MAYAELLQIIIFFVNDSFACITLLIASIHFVVDEESNRNTVKFRLSNSVNKLPKLNIFSGGNCPLQIYEI